MGNYTLDLLRRFNMHNYKASPTPMCTNEKFQCDISYGDTKGGRYTNLIGKLIYLTHTQPDISYTVEVLSMFMNKTSKVHAGATKEVLRYLAWTVDYGLNYTHASVWQTGRLLR